MWITADMFETYLVHVGANRPLVAYPVLRAA